MEIADLDKGPAYKVERKRLNGQIAANHFNPVRFDAPSVTSCHAKPGGKCEESTACHANGSDHAWSADRDSLNCRSFCELRPTPLGCTRMTCFGKAVCVK